MNLHISQRSRDVWLTLDGWDETYETYCRTVAQRTDVRCVWCRADGTHYPSLPWRAIGWGGRSDTSAGPHTADARASAGPATWAGAGPGPTARSGTRPNAWTSTDAGATSSPRQLAWRSRDARRTVDGVASSGARVIQRAVGS
jgi:hypothetical protein